MLKAIALGGVLWLAAAAPASALPLRMASTTAAVEDVRADACQPELQLVSTRY